MKLTTSSFLLLWLLQAFKASTINAFRILQAVQTKSKNPSSSSSSSSSSSETTSSSIYPYTNDFILFAFSPTRSSSKRSKTTTVMKYKKSDAADTTNETVSTTFFFDPPSSQSTKPSESKPPELTTKKATTNNNNDNTATESLARTIFKPAQADIAKSSDEYPLDFNIFIQETIDKYKNDDLVDIPKLQQRKQSWWIQYQELYEYFLATGRTTVPQRCRENQKLALWVNNERFWYKRSQHELLPSNTRASSSSSSSSSLSNNDAIPYYFNNTFDQTRYVLMNEIQFLWVAKPQYSLPQQWLERYEQLCDFVECYGNARVPIEYNKNPQLGRWVSYQRTWYKSLYLPNKMNLSSNDTDLLLKACVDQQRVNLLESIGFEWSLRQYKHSPKNREGWYKQLKLLKKFKQEFGHCNVPETWERNRSLGRWVATQRRWYKRITDDDGNLIKYKQAYQERIDLLNKVGFDWVRNSKKDLSPNWLKRYNELKEFKAKYGHCNVPRIYAQNPELGIWVAQQRQWNMHFNERGSKQQVQVDELANVLQGKQRISELENPFINNSTSRIGCNLGQNVNRKRFELLENLGFNWTVPCGPTFHDRYQELLEFKKRHGHTNVPQRWKQNKSLGYFVSNLRLWYRRNTDENGNLLDPKDATKLEKFTLLNDIGFQWTSKKEENIRLSWMDRYNELCEYVDRFGNANVPYGWKDNTQLAVWVETQRMMYSRLKRSGRLKSHRVMQQKVNLLDKVGFKWHVQGESHWWKMYNKLVLYKENNNNSLDGLATSSYIRQDLELYQFLMRLRRHVKEYFIMMKKEKQEIETNNYTIIETNHLNQDQIEALEEIGLCRFPSKKGDDIMGWTKQEVAAFEEMELKRAV